MRLLHGRPVAERINARTKDRVAKLAARGVTPRLAILSAGEFPDARTYRWRIAKLAKELGIEESEHAYAHATAAQLSAHLRTNTRDAHGVLLLTPLPPDISEEAIAADIPTEKDIEGVHPENVGLLTLGRPRFIPSTAEAALELLRFYDVKIDGAHAVVVGRSPVVGRPAATLLLHAHATVTLAHSRTADLAAHTRDAQIVVVAVGKKGFISGDMLARGATVIDAGINVTPSGLVGDVDVDSVSSVAGALSPVPGGLGAITTALLLRNVVTAAERQGGD
jgi:methylenetetrahydrofolate dehydrogenase (NADP+)/methenyltetrahydrofolate cyclohydrolase